MAIVTLTTIPSRLSSPEEQGIKACIDSLVNQSYESYEIHFNIPYSNKLTGQNYVIPDWLEKTERVKIFRTEDLGPVTKLLPTVKRIEDPEKIIIVVDDDLVYHHDMVATQIENQKKWKESPVGYDGIRSRDKNGNFSSFFGDSRDYYYTSQKSVSRVDILQHYKSVSYKRRFFEEDFEEFVKENYSWEDDLLIAAYMSHKKRDRVVETHDSIPELTTFDDWINKGGVSTFPVLRHTHHETLEGCNLFRQQKKDEEKNLYRFIDTGYEK